MAVGKSKWRLATTNGITGSILYGTLGGGEFLMIPDDQPDVTYRFPYEVGGVGLSALPVGLDFSHESMPGTGTRILHVDNKLVKPADFIGFFYIITAEANVGPGVATSLINFGAPPFWKKGLCGLVGGQAGMPGAGVSACVGYVIDWY